MAGLLWDCKRRGMAAPVLAIGNGALGFWAALRDVFPATRKQRCWFHKIANVLNALPSPPGNGGVPSTHPTSSLSCGPEPGSPRASWSNVPANQEAISTSHDRPSAGLDDCSCAGEGAPEECC
jgi:hypothetical protein